MKHLQDIFDLQSAVVVNSSDKVGEVEELLESLERELYLNEDNQSILKQMPLPLLAKLFRDFEKGKTNEPPIRLSFPHNAVPATKIGDCQSLLIGWIIDKRDFKERMPLILKSFLICKHKIVVFKGYYWDGIEWSQKWKGAFNAVCRDNGAKIYRKILDGKGRAEQIL